MSDDSGYARKGSLRREIFRILGRELGPPRRRWFLYLLFLLIAAGVVLDTLGRPISGFLGVSGAAGLAIYFGLILLLGQPSEEWGEDTLIRIFGVVWISVGLIGVVNFVVSWIALAKVE